MSAFQKNSVYTFGIAFVLAWIFAYGGTINNLIVMPMASVAVYFFFVCTLPIALLCTFGINAITAYPHAERQSLGLLSFVWMLLFVFSNALLMLVMSLNATPWGIAGLIMTVAGLWLFITVSVVLMHRVTPARPYILDGKVVCDLRPRWISPNEEVEAIPKGLDFTVEKYVPKHTLSLYLRITDRHLQEGQPFNEAEILAGAIREARAIIDNHRNFASSPEENRQMLSKLQERNITLQASTGDVNVWYAVLGATHTSGHAG